MRAFALNGTRTRPGFTLVEMLITVGALAIIAVGLATVFDATGKTVTTGRRVSAMNEYAALIERQLRADFEDMTREGFLVIRNEYADQGAHGDAPGDVPLTSQSIAGGDDTRPRRVDELMFFVRRPVSTAREAPVPGMVARGDAARVYYGHAQGVRPDLRTPTTRYRRPEVNDDVRGSDLLGDSTSGNPNRYASQWNLVRHLTVLARPVASQSRTFGNDPGEINLPSYLIAVAADSDSQIALQPAATSIFRRIAGLGPVATTGGEPLRGPGVFASGIVDVATTNLTEIQEVVETVGQFPNQTPGDPNLAAWASYDGLFASGSGGLQTAGFMQAWMDDAFPANSMSQSRGDRSRIRAERSPPDFHGVLATNIPQRQRAFRKADQLALSSSVFVPACTEFIVEWSFGVTHRDGAQAGEFIWHGLHRWTDLDGDGDPLPPPRGIPGLSDPEVVAYPYSLAPDGDDILEVPLRLKDPSAGLNVHPIDVRLIHGAMNGENGPLTSYFGFHDPMFNADNGGQQAADRSMPWPWPKLIRITMSIADPNDPSFEQVFQFVFETPEAERRGF